MNYNEINSKINKGIGISEEELCFWGDCRANIKAKAYNDMINRNKEILRREWEELNTKEMIERDNNLDNWRINNK